MRVKDIILIIAVTASLVFCSRSKSADKPMIIAVVDTGYSHIDGVPDVQLCKFGHADFYSSPNAIGSLPKDENGHGTVIAHIINDDLVQNGLTNFCLVIVKYSDGNKIVKAENLVGPAKYLNTLKNINVINYSSSGSYSNDEEKRHIVSILNRGVKIFAAAGNDGAELKENIVSEDSAWTKLIGTKKRDAGFYPAMYDSRINVIGALRGPLRWNRSNYGKPVTQWEEGLYVFDKQKYIGSSNATAVATRKYVKSMLLKKQNDSF